MIINNPVGQNKVLQIYPEAGIGHNLHRDKEDSKLQVKGESVSVYKNTGPGTAMGVYSRLSQLQNKISPSIEIPMQHSFEGTHSDIILRNQTPTLKNHQQLPAGSSPRQNQYHYLKSQLEGANAAAIRTSNHSYEKIKQKLVRSSVNNKHKQEDDPQNPKDAAIDKENFVKQLLHLQ